MENFQKMWFFSCLFFSLFTSISVLSIIRLLVKKNMRLVVNANGTMKEIKLTRKEKDASRN